MTHEAPACPSGTGTGTGAADPEAVLPTPVETPPVQTAPVDPRLANLQPDRHRQDPAVRHLHPEVAARMHWPNDRRILFAKRDLWVEHTAAKTTIEALEDALESPRVQQMPCLCIAARSRNGKSTVLKRFDTLHPVVDDEEHEPSLPVLLMEMPERPKIQDFWHEMLTALDVSHRPNDHVSVMKEAALRNIRAYRCRMLMIDEIHNLLLGSISEQRAFLLLLKRLTNQLMLSVVVAGTQDAIRTLKTDEQFEGRFDTLPLPKWKIDTEYLSLLASLETLMPLHHPSGLATRELAEKIFFMSERTIGSITKIVATATQQAIRDGSDRITTKTLDRLALKPLSKFKGEDL